VRLFTAIEIPDAWRDQAVRAQEQLAQSFEAELRLVRRSELHVTVRFLGEVDPDSADALARAIEAMPPFAVDLSLGRAGTFGPAARTSVVWLGVGIDEEQAAALLERTDEAIASALDSGDASEQAWRPHLTLARVRRQVGRERRREIAAAVRDLPAPAPHSTLVTTLSLFRSDLGNRAPRHKLLARSAVS
jgi:2'-5' RNA ligase